MSETVVERRMASGHVNTIAIARKRAKRKSSRRILRVIGRADCSWSLRPGELRRPSEPVAVAARDFPEGERADQNGACELLRWLHTCSTAPLIRFPTLEGDLNDYERHRRKARGTLQ